MSKTLARIALIRHLFALALLACLSACGGGGSPSSLVNPLASNQTQILVDGGPASLKINGFNGVPNAPYVTLTICAPGSITNCQTVDHIIMDTGSVGLRIQAQALNAYMLAALPVQTDASSRNIGECYQYVEGYVWGSVRSADLTIGGETSGSMPMQVIGDNLAPVPTACASSGGTSDNSIAAFNANGIIGIGTNPTDCGTLCSNGTIGSAGYPYYACTGTGSSATCVQTAQGASTGAPNQQLPNPVSTFAVDNNGTLISMPSVPSGGQANLTGTLTFGIGTRTNNGLGSANIVPASIYTGYIVTLFDGYTLANSYVDSGTSVYTFNDGKVPYCTSGTYAGFYCPPSPLTLSAINVGQNGLYNNVSFTVSNPSSMNLSYSVLPQMAVVASAFGQAIPTAFAWGFPFFYGRNVYTAIAGASTPGGTGPYFAY
ncbi:MAG: DUF3443 family protein [Curvibacter sp.]|nr:DUF3443 family protein [Curvibacter sp.]